MSAKGVHEVEDIFLNNNPDIHCALVSTNEARGGLVEKVMKASTDPVQLAPPTGPSINTIAVVFLGDPNDLAQAGTITVSFRLTANRWNTSNDPGHAPTAQVAFEDANGVPFGPPPIRVGYFEVDGNENNRIEQMECPFDMQWWPLLGGCNLNFWNGHLQRITDD